MPNFSGIWTVTQQMQAKGASTWPATPGAPTIGTATISSGSTTASVPFTAPACAGFPATITGFTATSTPSCFTATGASSPLSVSGLSIGTAYTFKVKATNATGTGPCSAASNSITPTPVVGQQAYTTAGTFSWVAPTGVTSVSVVAIGAGGGTGSGSGTGGSGGGLGYINNYAVTPGSSYTVVVAARPTCTAAPNSYFVSTAVVKGGGGSGCRYTVGTYTGDGGGNGGSRGQTTGNGAGGGAGGYSGAGGNAGYGNGCSGTAGAGGGGGGGAYKGSAGSGGGGGTGIFGQGANGAGGGTYTGGSGPYQVTARAIGGCGGSGGTGGSTATYYACFGGSCYNTNSGGPGNYGGGGVFSSAGVQIGAQGAVRIIWPGSTRQFPSTCTGNL